MNFLFFFIYIFLEVDRFIRKICSFIRDSIRDYFFLFIESSYFILLLLVLVVIIFNLLSIAITTLLERKAMSSIQRRRGPNIVGFFGLLQPIADGLKLLLKEIILPSNSNVFIFLFSSILTLFCSMLLWLVIPFSDSILLLDLSYSSLYLLAVSSFSVYGIIFSGWSSNSKYAFLGGLRSAAQMISYEVTIGLVYVSIIVMCDSFSFVDFVLCQEYVWFVFPLFPLYIVFFISMLAETNRAPFDLPEAEAELVAGYNVEYSSIAFALFFLGEYGNMILMSTLNTIFFLGGWFPIFNITLFNELVDPYIWIAVKTAFNVFVFVWVRASLPRYRYDQLMKFCWKVLLPVTLFLVFFFQFILIYFEMFI
jgi:NADH-quinone oxidoreductase subunit H